jgi:hypothetical protein
MGSLTVQRSFYTTTFQGTANPFVEAANWLNGATDGTSWKDMQTTPGLTFGTQTGNSGTYDDSTAILAGIWKPDATITTTCKSINQQGSNCYCELEHRHRSALSALVNTGYEVNVRATHGKGGAGAAYTEIVRWNGAIGQFTPLVHIDEGSGNFTGLHDGDIFKSTMVGNVITAYINYGSGFVQVSTYDISTGNDGGTPGTPDSIRYASGNPGIGHWLHLNGATGVNLDDYGFTTFTVTAT